tara:strand:+ start:356 stop:502 length:147 start_codon:yes stop_codon:yes gene_type:complete
MWIKFLPIEILKKCPYCNMFGLPVTKVLKIGGTIAIFIYIISFFISLF